MANSKKILTPKWYQLTIYGTKNFIINTPHVSSLMMGYDIQDEKFLEDRFKAPT